MSEANEIMKDIDAVILTGGDDLHPSRYGEDEKIQTDYDLKKENSEFNIIGIADKQNKPSSADDFAAELHADQQWE